MIFSCFESSENLHWSFQLSDQLAFPDEFGFFKNEKSFHDEVK